MKKKLLTRTLQYYLLFSVVVVLIAAPVFYFATNRLFIHEADEVLYLHKNEFINQNLPALKEADISLWNRMSRDTKVEMDGPIPRKDSLYYQYFMDSLDNEMVPYRVLRSPVIIGAKKGTLMARVSMIESEALIFSIGKVFFIVLILLLTGLYFITRILSSSLWKPFYTTLTNLEQFDLDKSQLPDLPESNVEEFDRLNRSARNLLEKNIQIFKSQKEFIENAAHELQTPMALFLAKLDLLAQEVPHTKVLADTFSSLHHSASRIIKLNKNLLLLSKLENGQFVSYENVLINEVIGKQTQFLSEQTAEKAVTIRVDFHDQVTVNAIPTLLDIAISNLLLNALKHNVTDGAINVTLQTGVLTISNSGNATLKNDEKLFARFSTPGSKGGTGLGLAIVKKYVTSMAGSSPTVSSMRRMFSE